MEEMLDVVNELDEVIGQASRDEVHRHKRLHRATHIILTNSSQQIFVQLRAANKDTNPGLWDSSAAGHVDAGESYRDCAARELAEELGVVVPAGELIEIGQCGPSVLNGYEFVRIYAAESDGQITLEAGEVDDGKWVSEAELEQWLQERPEEFASTFVQLWQSVRGFRNQR